MPAPTISSASARATARSRWRRSPCAIPRSGHSRTIWRCSTDLLPLLPPDSARAAEIREALAAARGALHKFSAAEAERARALLAPALGKRGDDAGVTVSAVGHAHIDLAWLWPLRETVRKSARTFATALALMERYPDYVFGASQPQQYDWVKRHHPGLYARIKERVAEGRWEPQGAMWVEADLNLTGGEALVRQILYGKRFFRDEFGVEPACLWEPDVFGCSGAVPQLLAKSGVEFFMTQKLSWNWVTRHPHHTFWWEGIDGSKVLAHFPPEDTYNSSAAPRAVHKAATSFLEKSVSDRVLLLFGIGDGGGGPGEEHLEFLAREKNLAGLAPVVQEPSHAFFRHIAKDAARYPTWRGELYLERHQGTYTTQARSKRYNRKLELALRELEFASAMAAELAGHVYPHARLEEIWKEVLLYQFHDILPGSSIARVYDESLARYAALAAEIAELTAAADATLLGAIGRGAAVRPVTVLNSLSWQRDEWLRLGAGWVRASVPPLGYAVIDEAAAQSFAPPLRRARPARERGAAPRIRRGRAGRAALRQGEPARGVGAGRCRQRARRLCGCGRRVGHCDGLSRCAARTLRARQRRTRRRWSARADAHALSL